MDVKEIKDIYKDKVKTALAVGILFNCILAYFILIKADLGRYNFIKSEIARLNSNILIVKDIDEQKKFLRTFEQSSVMERKEDWLIENVTENARDYGITVDFIQPLTRQNMSGYELDKVKVSGKALYHDIVDFLESLEFEEQYIIVEHCTIKGMEIKELKSRNSYNARRKPSLRPLKEEGIANRINKVLAEERDSEASNIKELAQQKNLKDTDRIAVFDVTILAFNKKSGN